jgi:hypothetical protein
MMCTRYRYSSEQFVLRRILPEGAWIDSPAECLNQQPLLISESLLQSGGSKLARLYDILSAEAAYKSAFNESPDILKNKVPDGYAVVDRKRQYGGVVPIISGSIGRYHPYVHSREARIHAARVLGRNKGDVDQVSGSNENCSLSYHGETGHWQTAMFPDAVNKSVLPFSRLVSDLVNRLTCGSNVKKVEIIPSIHAAS